MTLFQTELVIRSAKDKDRTKIASLMQFETYVHRHLDWRPPLDWIGHAPFLVMEQGQRITAALVCPPDPPGVAWIRMFSVSIHTSTQLAWKSLWQKACQYLVEHQVHIVAAIPINKWFQDILLGSGFYHTHDVVMLAWTGGDAHVPVTTENARIRQMSESDLDMVVSVDEKSFGALWRNTRQLLEIAYGQALSATVAERNGEVIGYQISTPSPYGVHLSRLAVHPKAQSQGIGYMLVCDLISTCREKNYGQLTVNTQHDNEISLSLYQKAGFTRTGERYSVYQYELN
jgi:ribosomal-protein-alanine N-acetyltransferase